MELADYDRSVGAGDVHIQDALLKQFLPGVAICANTFVATPNHSSAAMRTVRSRPKGASPVRRIATDMRQSIDLACPANGKVVKGYSAGWIT